MAIKKHGTFIQGDRKIFQFEIPDDELDDFLNDLEKRGWKTRRRVKYEKFINNDKKK